MRSGLCSRLAMSQQARDDKRRAKAAKLEEEDLRLKVRLGTKQALLDGVGRDRVRGRGDDTYDSSPAWAGPKRCASIATTSAPRNHGVNFCGAGIRGLERFHSSSSFRMKKECDTRWVKNLATRVRVVALTCIRYQCCEAAGKAITKLPRHFIGKVNKPGALVKSNRFPSVPLNLSLVNSNCCSDFLIGRLGIQGIFSSPSMG